MKRSPSRVVPRVGLVAETMVLLGLATLACAQPLEDDDVLHLQLRWTHQAQFAGFYVAEALGFYEREGVRVEIVPGGLRADGSAIDGIEELRTFRTDVAIGWLSTALAARTDGADVVNVAQVFAGQGLALTCLRARGVHDLAGLEGRRIGVWNLGDEIAVEALLRRNGIDESSVDLVQQRADGADLYTGDVDCGTVMTYNEVWTLREVGLDSGDLITFDLGDLGVAPLEDGLYVRAASLENPVFVARLAGFLRASADGWSYAQAHPALALDVVRTRASSLDPRRQQGMLDAILTLLPDDGIGMLDLAAYDRSVDLVARAGDAPAALRTAAASGWTHGPWLAATGEPQTLGITPATLHRVDDIVSSRAFWIFSLLGYVIFAFSGLLTAFQLRYDLSGALVLTSLKATGGATLRDLLIGEARRPLFILTDPAPALAIAGVLILGTLAIRSVRASARTGERLQRAENVTDMAGIATYTLVGAAVALQADLAWYWVPVMAAMTNAGGGVLTDLVTGREPSAFKGHLYEELAALGALLLLGLLGIASRFEHAEWTVPVALGATWIVVFAMRYAAVRWNLRSPILPAIVGAVRGRPA